MFQEDNCVQVHLQRRSPSSGESGGTSVTITGTSFGSSQGSGAVTLGSLAGQVVSWSDTQVVATVASGSRTGIARVQQNSVPSNSLPFTVTGTGASVSKLVPTVINMAVGDTRTIQALSAANPPVTGLTWTSIDPTVSRSTDDPPILSALTVGHVTITAGGASADVTVSATLSLGTILWSNPGDGSGVSSIVPAVPSSTGVADVFAFQNDGTVQAITADGTVAWTASAASCEAPLPDFQGGLILAMCGGNAYDQGGTIVKLDGLTGQTVASIAINGTYPDQVVGLTGPPAAAIHPDGTIFTILYNGNTMPPTIAGYDSMTGAQKFAVPFNLGSLGQSTNKLIIAGDGYAYMPYQTISDAGPGFVSHNQRLLRVNSSGAYDDISVMDWVGAITGDPYYDLASIITNADTGVVMTVQTQSGVFIATTTGTAVSVSSVAIPSAAALGSNNYPSLAPVLQAQDGSFVGTMGIPMGYGVFSYMVNFDASGNIRWSVPNESPVIATADGGVIGASGETYDGGGSVTTQLVLATQSWTDHMYQVDLAGQVAELAVSPVAMASTLWAQRRANRAGTGTSPPKDVATKLVIQPSFNGRQDCYVSVGNASTGSFAERDIVYQVVNQHGGWMPSVKIREELIASSGTPCPSGTVSQNGFCEGQYVQRVFSDSYSANPQTGHSEYTQSIWVETLPNVSGYSAFFGKILIDAYQPTPSPTSALASTQFLVNVNGNPGKNPDGTLRRCN